MKKEKIEINPAVVIKKCDKCCGTCYHVTTHGSWLECRLDGTEVHPGWYCSSYRGDGR